MCVATRRSTGNSAEFDQAFSSSAAVHARRSSSLHLIAPLAHDSVLPAPIDRQGEAGRLFVSFVHNGDQHERFHHPNSHPYQITVGIALLFTLQGIPSLYYGIRIRS
jgi:glycosidase